MYIYEIKKSRFIATSYDVVTKDDINKILSQLKVENKGATHICYAYILDSSAGMSDDGEPSGTAGKPLFNLLNIKKHTNKLVVVVRYYGGKKLGASGLIRAYINSAKHVL